ncbi:MAG: F-box protein [Chlamydiales bacterium]|nr:F-box protein [Chlamydiales bacterium]
MVSISSDLSSHIALAQLGGVSNADNVLSPIDALPDELMLKIFSYLNGPTLVNCQGVSEKWRRLAGDPSFEKKIQLYRTTLEILRAQGNLIDERAWKLLGEIGEVPPLPDNIFEELMKPCPFWNPERTADGKKVKDTHVLGLMVDKVNGEPVTLTSIERCASTPKEGGHATRYRQMGDDILKDLGNTPVGKPYWALMTAEVIPGSRGKSREDQLAMATKLGDEATGYKAPTLLQAIAFSIVSYVSTEKRLFCNYPWIGTYCLEESGLFRLAVVSISSSHLDVSRNIRDSRIGVAALRKF